MRRSLDADYLVVGAGASGMAFVDALVDHAAAGTRVVVVDRRHGPGGHWLDAYPFVRLHQASSFYGVASTELGDGRVQAIGPEQGLHERADAAQICAYYAQIMKRLSDTGNVTFLPACDHLGDGLIRSRVSGQEYTVRIRRRLVDAHYLQPDIPATTPPPFRVSPTARVIPVNALASLQEAPRRYVVVGSGKTATDACVWLLLNGVDPDRICWIRPREPWMLNRAVVQPDPGVFLGMAADVLEAATWSSSLDDLFLRLEDAGVMLRIDRRVRPTMARAPTLAGWELDLLRSVENVVRMGYVREVGSDAIVLTDGKVPLARDTIVVNCTARGLRDAPVVPIWGADRITLQPIRSGFPCFAAALTGYVEATRTSDEEKNRLCPASPYGGTLAGWVRMQVLGGRAAAAFGSAPDIREWAHGCTLNPARIQPGQRNDPNVQAVLQRLQAVNDRGMARMAELAGMQAA